MACIRTKCQDPCPGTCGIGAICTVSNHIPVCSCPQPYIGDAFTRCQSPPINKVSDPCHPSPCGPNTICEYTGQRVICKCLPGLEGEPTSLAGCRAECVLSSDCPSDKTCENNRCINPCTHGVCGVGAVCRTISHSPVCSCPVPLAGNPFEECYTKKETDPCNPSPCNINGECRIQNGVAFCVYPECLINSDCPRDRTCFSQRCRDPCIGACGVNSLCRTINHNPICSCPSGFTGNPQVQCKISTVDVLKPECTSNSECSNDKTCWEEKCIDPCVLGSCGFNSRCQVLLHRAVCVCHEGFTGNPQQACSEIGCRSDHECSVVQSCVNNECTDVCSFTQCGINAVCESDRYHRPRCVCLEGYQGDPNRKCDRPECLVDTDCSLSLTCQNSKCIDPCNCPSSAQCFVINHRPTCKCPPGFTGDARKNCVKQVEPIPQCMIDADCPSKFACFDGSCKDPCRESRPCVTDATCSVIDTLPMRTMICECLPNYIGDATIACAPIAQQIEILCRSNSECDSNKTCLNKHCVNPCVINPCSTTAECHVKNHQYICICPPGTIGDPFLGCQSHTASIPECKTNTDCPSHQACINHLCQNPCSNDRCGLFANCVTVRHHPTCHCPQGYAGDPQNQCFKPECNSDNDCPYNKLCRNGHCRNPCDIGDVICGRGAECAVTGHRAYCNCPSGTQGDPRVACISAVCHYNEDCPDHEACDRLNRVCRRVCDDDSCAETAVCIAKNHQSNCICNPGTTGNPYVECTTISHVHAECQTDSECPPLLACINTRCQDPCALTDMCTQEQQCRVLNTVPLRTMICECPSDTFTDIDGICKKIVWSDVQCHIDEECSDVETCVSGKCIEACLITRCGINAQCKSSSHSGVCVCASEYTGNPYIECSPEPRSPLPPLLPECSFNDECPNDRQCINLQCVNPCVSSAPCGKNSLCHVDKHNPVCKCPINYMGDSKIECIPPSLILGCAANSECAGTEACVNGHCINPCNCGPNSNCIITNHYPLCACNPGYSGNPQLGCTKVECETDQECSNKDTCHERRCINPCLLDNTCAINAKCFGKNHRSNCECLQDFIGNPYILCERPECTSDYECPQNRVCNNKRCVDPCLDRSPCASNAICYVVAHTATCRCPENIPDGNPFSYCERHPAIGIDKPECQKDTDCPSRLACIDTTCVDPCATIKPCLENARCGVLDTVPVRTMICTCPDGWITDSNGFCQQIPINVIGICSSDSECPDRESCINRHCRDPCSCGTNANCFVRNHKPICSCLEGYQGNPEIACNSVECQSDFECMPDKSCINNNCVNPCLFPTIRCGTNAECITIGHAAECQCREGYQGNPRDKCHVIGCYSNGDCPGDRACVNKQCIDPCIHSNPCTARAECSVRGHLPSCRCPPGYVGNPHVDCRIEDEPECRQDSDCPNLLACFNGNCQNPCAVVEPCIAPSECQILPTLPIKTMICDCPNGYISSGSGTCKPIAAIIQIGCTRDDDCASDKACVNAVCRDPCACGNNANCNIVNHKPICSCISGYDGNPDIECNPLIECKSNSQCSDTHMCIQNICVPACSSVVAPCANDTECYGIDHQAVCKCSPGFAGNPRLSCTLLGCRSNSDCPTNKACINKRCENPCVKNPCTGQTLCSVYNHVVECSCPPGYAGNINDGCEKINRKCIHDYECPSETACFNGECINPCVKIAPCGVNAQCNVLDTKPVRTMICECIPGYRGNAVIRCDKTRICSVEKGQIRDDNGNCVCPPQTAKDEHDICVPCRPEAGMIITPDGFCVCALEKGLIIDQYGHCVCPTEHNYKLDSDGNCKLVKTIECIRDDNCAGDRYCEPKSRTCEDPCLKQICATNAICTATRHRAICNCINGYIGDGYEHCIPDKPKDGRTDFPKPEMEASCLSDGVQVQIHVQHQGFDGVLYVRGRSKEEQCRRILSIPADTNDRTETFKVNFGSCGLIHVNGEASFVLVIQKHPKLVTYKAQAYHVKCMYQTGEQNVTLGFNVSMLTTAGTIANTGPPPTCLMRIVTQTGSEIQSAEIGDNLMLQVEVQPSSIYGGFARNCVAKTMEDNQENEYIVTDENGCATDPTIFGEWGQDHESQTLLASFNAFKFPSSDNIRFQCNIRVCFGRCQPVNKYYF